MSHNRNQQILSKRYRCSTCGKHYMMEWAFKNHMKNHKDRNEIKGEKG